MMMNIYLNEHNFIGFFCNLFQVTPIFLIYWSLLLY